MSTFHVKNIASLEALNGAMGEYRSQSDEPFHHFAPVFERKLQLLAALETHFVQKIEQAEQNLRYAESAYNACICDPNRISCSSEESWVRQAESDLQQAIENLASYKSTLAGLQSAFGDYQHTARSYANHLQNISSSIVPNFSAVIAKMHDYLKDDGFQPLPTFGDIPHAGGAVNAVGSVAATAVSGAETGTTGTVNGENIASTEKAVPNASVDAAKEEPSATISDGAKVAAVAGGGVTLAALITGGVVLKKGIKKDDNVEYLQERLKELGYKDLKNMPLKPDKDFGGNTEHALKNFQKDFGLEQTGVADEKTWKKFEELNTGITTFFELKKLSPNASNEFLQEQWRFINTDGAKFDLTDKTTIALYLAQTGHETTGFSKFKESLNYTTPQRLAEVFPSYFHKVGEIDKTKKNPLDFVGKEKETANYVYGGRFGNNNIDDGSKYLGQGAMHLTFKENYEAFNKYVKEKYPNENKDFVESPHLLQEPKYAMMSSAWFWKYKVVDPLGTGTLNIDSATKKISPAMKSLIDRNNRLIKACNVLDISKEECENLKSPIIKGLETNVSNVFDKKKNLNDVVKVLSKKDTTIAAACKELGKGNNECTNLMKEIKKYI